MNSVMEIGEKILFLKMDLGRHQEEIFLEQTMKLLLLLYTPQT
jgi:hypothetical protein